MNSYRTQSRIGIRYRDSPYLKRIYRFGRSVEEMIPTLENTLDWYFDAHFDEIIEEWHLLTDAELHHLETRLDEVTAAIDTLWGEKTDIEKRADSLRAEIEALQGGIE